MSFTKLSDSFYTVSYKGIHSSGKTIAEAARNMYRKYKAALI